MLHVALLVLSLAIPSASSQQTPQCASPPIAQPSKQHENLSAGRKGSTSTDQPTPQAAGPVQNHPNKLKAFAYCGRNEKPRPNSPQLLLFVCNILMVIITGCLAYNAWRQSKIMDRNAQDTREIAKATNQSARTAEAALHDLERSWILIEPQNLRNLDGHWDGAPPLQVTLTWEIQNAGRAPTWPVRLSAKIQAMSPSDLTGSPQYEKPSSNFTTRPIGPNKGTPGDECRGFFEEVELAEIQLGKRNIYFFGFVDYRDVFGTHSTKFCFIMKNFVPKTGDFRHPTIWDAAGGDRWNSYT